METILVRQAVLTDVVELAQLFDAYRQFYGKQSDITAANDFLMSMFNHGESTLFIAYEGINPVGFTQLYPMFSSVSLARVFILNDLFVLEHARRNGVATKLLNTSIDFARALGAIRVSLTTAISNESAQTLYRSVGWKKDEQYFTYHLTFN